MVPPLKVYGVTHAAVRNGVANDHASAVVRRLKQDGATRVGVEFVPAEPIDRSHNAERFWQAFKLRAIRNGITPVGLEESTASKRLYELECVLAASIITMSEASREWGEHPSLQQVLEHMLKSGHSPIETPLSRTTVEMVRAIARHPPLYNESMHGLFLALSYHRSRIMRAAARQASLTHLVVGAGHAGHMREMAGTQVTDLSKLPIDWAARDKRYYQSFQPLIREIWSIAKSSARD